ncbi:hypothetical protein ACFWZ1_10415 [Frateuria sp. GZRe14]|jgi:hypothetical protein|uniref:TolB family protein n=1 Tax=Frateuria sp. GZRe14 TaxID=3351534 RepID=UPI003EDC6207
MKTHKRVGSICALLLTALGAPPADAQSSTAAVLFSRTQYTQDNRIDSISIFRTDPQGLRTIRLTPRISGYQFKLGGWSPQGTGIVYELVRNDRPAGQSQLYVMDRQGGGVRQVTHGQGSHSMPVWGPGGIAYAEGRCLALVRGDGENQHVLFCPPDDHLLRRPQWTTDGTSLLIQAGHRGGPQGPIYQTLWRVNASTGQATRLFRLEDEQHTQQPKFSFSPTREEGMLWGGGWPALRVTFSNGYFWSYNSEGYGFKYAPGGNRVAFGGYLVLPDGTGFSNLYVSDRREGSDTHQLSRNYSNPDIHWVPVQWSRDAQYVLAIRRTLNAQRSLPPVKQELRIVEVATGRQTRLPDGEAIEGAWFQP